MRLSLGTRSLSAAIHFKDGSKWALAEGISSNTPYDPATPAHHYCIGSVTKSITAACVLQLADEGKLDLDARVGDLLPAFPHVNPNITVRQLLRHQSGLYDVITNPAYDQASKSRLDSIWSLSNLVRDYIKAPLFAPGTNWSYSNTNYALLGLIVEAVTGKPYYEEYERRFFTPLNTATIVLPPYDPYPAKVAHLWTDTNGDGVTEDLHSFFSRWRSFQTSAGPIGAYYATAGDVATWMRAFLRGDLHTEAILNEAKTTVATTMPASGRYGLGIMERKFLGLTAYGHGGDIGYSAISYYFPAKDIGISVLNNDATKISWDLAPVIQALLKAYLDYETLTAAQSPGLETFGAKIAPNPFSEQLALSLSLPDANTDAQVVLLDALGSTVARTETLRLPAGTHQIPLSDLGHLPRGLYWAQVWIDGVRQGTIKVVK